MSKKRFRDGRASFADGMALAQAGEAVHQNGNGHQAAQIAAQAAEAEIASASGRPQGRPKNHRELGKAIFDLADPVKAGAELLEPGEKKSDPVRLNALKAFADWAFGRHESEAQRRPPRVIWDLPCPPYEPADPVEAEALEGGEK